MNGVVHAFPAFEDLRLVVIESPYATFDDPSMREIWQKALALRMASYRQVYEPGVLPCDTYDFVCTHHLIGSGRKENFRPLMVYRMITTRTCDFHRLPFPGLTVLRSSNEVAQAEALEGRLREWTAAGELVSYGSGWAIDPAIRENPPLRNALKDLMTAMLVHHEAEEGTDRRLSCGGLKVHTDRYFRNIGYSEFQGPSGGFPPFHQASLIGELAVLLECVRFSAEALELAEKHKSTWLNREAIRAPDLFAKIAA